MKEFFEGNYELPKIKPQKSGRLGMPPKAPGAKQFGASTSMERENPIKSTIQIKNNQRILRQTALENLGLNQQLITSSQNLKHLIESTTTPLNLNNSQQKSGAKLKQSIVNGLAQ